MVKFFDNMVNFFMLCFSLDIFIFTTRLAKNEKLTSALGAFIELNYT